MKQTPHQKKKKQTKKNQQNLFINEIIKYQNRIPFNNFNSCDVLLQIKENIFHGEKLIHSLIKEKSLIF